MTKEIHMILRVCPEPVRSALAALPDAEQGRMEELRLRLDRPASIVVGGREWNLLDGRENIPVDAGMLRAVLDAATERSAYAAQGMLREGFLTLPGGHRLGVCGEMVMKDGAPYALKNISSVNLRIARQVSGIGEPLAAMIWANPKSTLIIGAPGSGKTTLLREGIRQLSDRFSFRVSVADERNEISASCDGSPGFQIGRKTDVLCLCPKALAMERLLRSMNPQWIAVDEITAAADIAAMEQVSYCGVLFLATAHATGLDELRRRPVYRRLLETRLFENLAIVGENRQITTMRIPYDD